MHPIKETAKLCHTVGEMARELNRSEQYVTDMKSGGFKLPATLPEAIQWIRDHGPVTQYRTKKGMKGE